MRPIVTVPWRPTLQFRLYYHLHSLKRALRRLSWHFRAHATTVEQLLAARRIMIQESICGQHRQYFLLEELPEDEMAIWNEFARGEREKLK